MSVVLEATFWIFLAVIAVLLFADYVSVKEYRQIIACAELLYALPYIPAGEWGSAIIHLVLAGLWWWWSKRRDDDDGPRRKRRELAAKVKLRVFGPGFVPAALGGAA